VRELRNNGYKMLRERSNFPECLMLAADDSSGEETHLERELEREQAVLGQAKPGDLLNLISRFPESPGNVLLLQWGSRHRENNSRP